MLRRTALSILAILVISGVAAADVDVRVNVGAPPLPVIRVEQPPAVVYERETVIVKDRKDNGKHKGHYKQKRKHKGKGRE